MSRFSLLSLEISRHLFFFPFFFSNIHFVELRVVCIVSGSCNQFSSVFFYQVFESLYWCINVIPNPGKSFFFFFSWNILSVNVIYGMQDLMNQHEFSCSLSSICLSSSLLLFKNLPGYLSRKTAEAFIHFIRFLLYSLVWSSFLQRYAVLMFSFISTRYVAHFLYSQVFVSFLFSEHSDFFLI